MGIKIPGNYFDPSQPRCDRDVASRFDPRSTSSTCWWRSRPGSWWKASICLVFSGASYRQNVNRRLRLLRTEPNRENILLELRKQRGLTGQGNYRLGMEAINRLVLQSGLTVGLGKLVAVIPIGSMHCFCTGPGDPPRQFVQALLIAYFLATAAPYLVLRFLRGRRQRAFGAQFPDALDMIVRSLRAGTPFRSRSPWSRARCSDPIGSEFGIVVDEITYGSDLETALRNLYFASARTICRYSSPRLPSRDRPAAISARSSKTFRG